jgi:hypothetical protein
VVVDVDRSESPGVLGPFHGFYDVLEAEQGAGPEVGEDIFIGLTSEILEIALPLAVIVKEDVAFFGTT